jgi:nucleoside-diphosphate-sugar epimerase
MNVLILGGTRFLGRHIVDRLAASGHRIVCFHRGRTTCALPEGVDERLGDRNEDLGAVSGERWDAIVDTSGQRPEQLRRSLELGTERYLFVSSVSAYRDLSAGNIGEEAPTIEEFDPADDAQSYGGNKAGCERLVLESYPSGGIIFRPGLIAGAWDGSGRFTYWCERFLRGGHVLAPGAPSRPVQFVDAADVADFAEPILSNGTAGVFNVAGPAELATMEQLLRVCARVAAERGAPPAAVTWADDEFLLERGVQEWLELPLWLTDPQFAGILEVKNAKALAAGLRPRAIAQTINAALDWKPESRAANVGMSPEREAELLSQYDRLLSGLRGQ